MKKVFCISVLAVFLAGCASMSDRLNLADRLAQRAGMQLSLVRGGEFLLTSYQRVSDPSKPLNVYIEGDGFAWATRGRLSTNATPKDAFTLQLAAQDDAPNVVYIARPCQYTSPDLNPSCGSKYWSTHRFSEEVINSMNRAIDEVMLASGVEKVNLIGYSGGGAVVVLLAARRNDVESIRTVAGNLDHVAVNAYHKVSQMKKSLNPIDYANVVSKIPQYHFVGKEDKVVPLFVAEKFSKASGSKNECVKISTLEGATHHIGWRERWKHLLSLPVACKN